MPDRPSKGFEVQADKLKAAAVALGSALITRPEGVKLYERYVFEATVQYAQACFERLDAITLLLEHLVVDHLCTSHDKPNSLDEFLKGLDHASPPSGGPEPDSE